MTQPTSVNMTFDTSLVDVKPPLPSSPTKPIQHLPTLATYNQWASIYDTDGNILQAIDDLELASLLPDLLSSLAAPHGEELNILDLGCGTGRNTAKLLVHEWGTRGVNIVGLDFSDKMLEVAGRKVAGLGKAGEGVRCRFVCCDCFPTASSPSSSTTPSPLPSPIRSLPPFNLTICTLVLEHIPLTAFFATLAATLAPGGVALVTNMHDEMGGSSQAGFLRGDGVKVRGRSWVYGVEEVVAAARGVGLRVRGVRERAVGEADLGGGGLGERGRKWVGVRVWVGFVFVKGVV